MQLEQKQHSIYDFIRLLLKSKIKDKILDTEIINVPTDKPIAIINRKNLLSMIPQSFKLVYFNFPET